MSNKLERKVSLFDFEGGKSFNDRVNVGGFFSIEFRNVSQPMKL